MVRVSGCEGKVQGKGLCNASLYESPHKDKEQYEDFKQ